VFNLSLSANHLIQSFKTLRYALGCYKIAFRVLIWYYRFYMRKYPKELDVSQLQITLPEFLASYNKNMPQGFPRASTALLKKFQAAHSALFKNGDLWSLEQHRKKLMDWLPRNSDVV